MSSYKNVLCKPLIHEAEEMVLHKTSAVGPTEIYTFTETDNMKYMALDGQKHGV